jgi:hypothetical protein
MLSKLLHRAEEDFDGRGPISSRHREINPYFGGKSSHFGPKLLAFRFFVFDFFNHLKVFSRPLQHADEEKRGPGSPSSRFREILILAFNHFFSALTPKIPFYCL